MIRNICVIMAMIICLMNFVPISVYAETYYLGGIDGMSVRVDDSSWYVFTRDNIKNNSELDDLGFSYDFLYNVLHDNEAFMYAILFYDDGEYFELVVKKRTIEDGTLNLSNYSHEKVLELAESFAKKLNSYDYSVYENRYKFSKVEYIDADYYVCDFFTVVSKDCYTFTFQSKSQFSDSHYDEMVSIIDSIHFDIDTPVIEKKWDSVVGKTIGGAVICGAVGAIVAIVNKKKRNSNRNDSQSCDGNIE